MELWPLR